eukprot:gb/GECH01013608.1/.p1 GENE.gb/GECH01013608.1/~~gb/GECH01013608.1/.p1  ORF type:complete len:181 (+),score=46.45 gb/GECH01013608.1/:1-543(+)
MLRPKTQSSTFHSSLSTARSFTSTHKNLRLPVEQRQHYSESKGPLHVKTNARPDVSLEWRMKPREDATLITHPSYEELLAVKTARLLEEQSQQRVHQGKSPLSVSTLSPEQVSEARQLREKNPWKYKPSVLAERYGVKQSVITKVAPKPKKKALFEIRKSRADMQEIRRRGGSKRKFSKI